MAAADLFVFPSLYEGLPGAVIEAMALSLPIVASNIAPIQEVVEDNRNALLVEPTSSNELATAIEMYRGMEMTFWLPGTEAALALVEGAS